MKKTLPGCLWFSLGAGISLVLVILGLLLVFAPAYRQGTSPVHPTADKATYTPYITLTATAYLEETATPTPYQDQPGQPETPDDLLTPTPTSREGYISISPYISADAMHYSLKVGQDVNLDWVDFPPGAAQYQIILIPDRAGTELLLIEDDNPADGIGGVWQVPEKIAGEVQGRAVFTEGHTVTSVSGGWIYSGHGQ